MDSAKRARSYCDHCFPIDRQEDYLKAGDEVGLNKIEPTESSLSYWAGVYLNNIHSSLRVAASECEPK